MTKLTISASLLDVDGGEAGQDNREWVHACAADAVNALSQLQDALRDYHLDAPRIPIGELKQLERAIALAEKIDGRVERYRSNYGDESDRFGVVGQAEG